MTDMKSSLVKGTHKRGIIISRSKQPSSAVRASTADQLAWTLHREAQNNTSRVDHTTPSLGLVKNQRIPVDQCPIGYIWPHALGPLV
ncbi:hypothetical protein DTO166G4_3278 [Paecilomyces variotii]|nr:hypothetical protein DTO166G4_3278 [Paecilomyces variotii]KAJ9222029.1 hypothetical protein DTO169C6_5658 [Paecilomyces variotii]KAJ9237665.1 hypothetical protein DTO166G5_3429 [Paecilomyces variotii]KAJ9261296.1 hypothetical protein DTO195F2_4322 [Paecilomyces variotii]KAJ9372813.1 hypothetical protein DTO282E5_2540 [Paecilomyces variotii]